MFYFVLVIHIIVSLFLVCIILLQQAKSADLAGAFGGQGSQTAFGPRSAASLLTKVTAYAGAVFLLTTVCLTVLLARSSGEHSVLSGSSHPISQSAPKK